MTYESFDSMSGLEKSALLLNILGNQVTAQIFKKMKDNDVKRLVSAMGQVTKVPIPAVKEVLEAFYSEISEEYTLIFGHAQGREFVLSTLGEDRAKTVLGQLSVLEGSRTLEALELVDPRTLANFLVNEHPQTVALILAHLEPNKKCEVLKRLPESIQTEVVLRIANLDFISPNLIAQVDEVLKQELATLGKGLKLRAERQPGLSSERRAEMNRVADNVMVAAKVRASRSQTAPAAGLRTVKAKAPEV